MSLSFEDLGLELFTKGGNGGHDFSDLGIDVFSKGQEPKEEELPETQQEEESFGQQALRTGANVGVGRLEATPYGIATNLINLIGAGEAFDPLEIERIKEISEREGVPFDEEKYLQAAKAATEYFPTPGNLANVAEDVTGLPLKANSQRDRLARLGGMGSKFAGIGGATGLQQAAAGGTASAGSYILQEKYGIPEPLADFLALSFGATVAPKVVPSIEMGAKTKPSGMKELGFEKLTKPREVTESKLAKINRKLETDFRQVSKNIIAESPVGETFENLKNDPSFKAESRELMQEAQTIADAMPDTIPEGLIAEKLKDIQIKKPIRGYAPSKYEKSYEKFVDAIYEDISKVGATPGKMVEQYRKNNDELGEFFQPGESKAVNRAQRDAILDHNRAITQVMEDLFPDSELVPVFKEGNERWTKIMDAEVIDEFIDDLFTDKVSFKHLKPFFDKEGYTRPFKRALGDEGFKEFEQLLKDFSKAEAPYKMLKVAKDKGYSDLAKTATSYFLSPYAAYGKVGLDLAKKTWKTLMNSMLDKPQIAFTLKKGIQDLKKGNFKEAEKQFDKLKSEVEVLGPEEEAVKAPKEETIEVAGERAEPSKKELAPLKEPKLVEYKPKTETKQDRLRSLSRKVFDRAVQGEKLTSTETSVLKETRVASLQTRGMGKQFHGTKKPINELNENIYDQSGEQNIFGAGFYTTDALDVADGYSKAKRAKQPTIYEIVETKPQKLYDAESPIEEFKKLYESQRKGESQGLIDEILKDDKPKSVREIYEIIADRGISDEKPAYEVQLDFDEVQQVLEKAGYQGLSHKGGLYTDTPEHQVKIYWNPENLEISEIKFPKGTKKSSKVAKNKLKEINKGLLPYEDYLHMWQEDIEKLNKKVNWPKNPDVMRRNKKGEISYAIKSEYRNREHAIEELVHLKKLLKEKKKESPKKDFSHIEDQIKDLKEIINEKS